MTIIASAWETYAKTQLPMDVTAAQRLTARRFFYAGAYCMDQICAEAQKMNNADHAHCAAVLRQELSIYVATAHTPLEGKV